MNTTIKNLCRGGARCPDCSLKFWGYHTCPVSGAEYECR